MENKINVDVAIIGAGPGGSAAAYALDAQVSAVIIDPCFEGGGRTKPCGGLLSEAAQKSLASFGIQIPLDVLVSPQCFAVTTVDLASQHRGHYPRTYTNMDRRRFDDYLRRLIPDAVRKVTGRMTKIERDGDSFFIHVESPTGPLVIAARQLIAADGGGSRVRRLLFPENQAQLLTAVQAHYHLADMPPDYACFYEQTITPAFGWSLCKDDVFIVGGAFLRNGSKDAFARFEKRVFENFGVSVPARRLTEACPVVWTRQREDVCLGDSQVLLVGEAAGLISPSSFEGISFALESGYRAGLSVLAGNPAAAYRRATAGLRRKLFVRRVKASLLAKAWVRRLAIRSGLDQVTLKARSRAL